MSNAEFADWVAFASHEPIGVARGDVQAAMQMMLTVNINRKKGSKKPKLQQFIPDYWDARKRPENLAAKFRGMVPSIDADSDTDEQADENE
jgi:hypothetical protein